jgi:hypothetical protein
VPFDSQFYFASGSDTALEPEALVRTQGERAVRKPNCGHHRRGLGELREADFHFPSLAIIAIPT